MQLFMGYGSPAIFPAPMKNREHPFYQVYLTPVLCFCQGYPLKIEWTCAPKQKTTVISNNQRY